MNRYRAAARTHSAHDIKERLTAYLLYAAIVEEQSRSLQDDDMPRFAELADRRAKHQAAIDERPVDLSGPLRLTFQEEALLQEVRKEMAKALTVDRTMQAQLRRLRAQTVKEVKSISQGEVHAKRYLIEDAAPAQDRHNRFDIRL